MKITRRQLRQIIKEESDLLSLFGDVISTGSKLAANVLDDPAVQDLVSGVLKDTDAITFIANLLKPKGKEFLEYLNKKGVDKEKFAVKLLGKLLKKELLKMGPPPSLKTGSDDAIADAVIEVLEDMNVQFGAMFGFGADVEKSVIKLKAKQAIKKHLGFALEESKITRRQLRQIIKEEVVKLDESAASGWPVFRTFGGGGMSFMSALGKIFRRGSKASNLLKTIPGVEGKHNTIYYDIEDGKVTTKVEPKDPKVLEVAEEIANIIAESGKVSATYKDMKQKKDTSGESHEDYEEIEVKRQPGKVMLSTDPKKKNIKWP